VLSDDFFSIPEQRIKSLESVLTIVGGKVVYAAEEFRDLAPPLLPVLPEWSPVARFGGYHSTPATAPAAAKAMHLCTALCNHIHRATCRTTSSTLTPLAPCLASGAAWAVTVLHSRNTRRFIHSLSLLSLVSLTVSAANALDFPTTESQGAYSSSSTSAEVSDSMAEITSVSQLSDYYSR
jgi:hypothetical protein